MRSKDLIAGLCVAGLMLPEGVAYAGIAGLAPQHAIFAGIAGCLAYAAAGPVPDLALPATGEEILMKIGRASCRERV